MSKTNNRVVVTSTRGRRAVASRRVARSRRAPSRRVNRRDGPITKVHRRLAVYPEPPQRGWLDTLAWFGSVAMKLFSIIYNVADDLTAGYAVTNAGVAVVLGASDFSAFTPYGSPNAYKQDREVKALRMLPFERQSLPSVQVKIVPTVDIGSRGGMYASVLVRADQIDQPDWGASYINRFDSDYDTIIKHPRAVLSPVTRTTTLTCTSPDPPRDLRVKWEDGTGFVNNYPSYVLMVAFSDMAATTPSDVSSQYTAGKSLFEVHLQGNLHLFEPTSMDTTNMNQQKAESCCVTQKLLTTGMRNINSASKYSIQNVKCYNQSCDVSSEYMEGGRVDLRHVPLEFGEHVLRSMDREDLLLELRAHHLSLKSK